MRPRLRDQAPAPGVRARQRHYLRLLETTVREAVRDWSRASSSRSCAPRPTRPTRRAGDRLDQLPGAPDQHQAEPGLPVTTSARRGARHGARAAPLDDSPGTDDVAAIRRRIPAESGGTWTLHAPVDPGVTLLELYAWLLEQRLYWLDQVPDSFVRAVLRLLGDAGRAGALGRDRAAVHGLQPVPAVRPAPHRKR